MIRLTFFSGVSVMWPFLLAIPACRAQGSLTPPGPPGPTMKTLAQIEPRTLIGSLPFVIQEPGSYYASTNLMGTAGSHGVVINASDVTLDLNGFVLLGLPGSLNGIHLTGAQVNVVVRNGTISQWGNGVSAEAGDHCSFERLRAFQNATNGLVGGTASMVDSCMGSSNQGAGITVGSGSVVRNCTAMGNGMHGIVAEAGTRLRDCTGAGNTGTGVMVAAGCWIEACLASTNSSHGFAAGPDAQIASSKAFSNGKAGFLAGADAALTACTATGNLEPGIQAGAGAHVIDCKASVNSKGIAVDSGSTVRGCNAHQNSGDGISVTTDCVVVGNSSSGNFLARDACGVRASGSGNVIESNRVISNDWGIRVDAVRNVIIRNVASNNSLNYSAAASPQSMGPVISSDTVADNTNPDANMEF